MKRAAWLLALSAGGAIAQAPSFMAGVEAHEAGDYARCADVLLAVEAAGAPMASNGELLAVECLSRAERFEDAFAYLRRQLPGGRISFGDLRDKSRPGLDALRLRPDWPAFLAEANRLEEAELARLDAPLRDELLQRAGRDQEARNAALGAPGGAVDEEKWRAIEAVDRDNTAWLKPIVEATGWPGSDRVGHDGAKAAWMLVQHADLDPAFQTRALAAMEAAVTAGTADADDFALLTDRVLVAQGKPQRYGTQFESDADGRMRMRPVEDEAGLDARRSAVGLPPMADYRKLLSETYGQPVE